MLTATGTLTPLGVIWRQLVFPVEARRRNSHVRQPEQFTLSRTSLGCDAFGLSIEGASDKLQAARIVIHQEGRKLTLCKPG